MPSLLLALALALQEASKNISQSNVLEISKLPGIHKDAVVATNFIPQVGLLPVRGLFHGAGAMRAADIVALVIDTAFFRITRVDSF